MKRHKLIDYLDMRFGLHSGNGAELLFYCPVCIDRLGTDSDKRKFAINIDKQRGRCFRCEYKFRSMETLFKYINGGRVLPKERIMLSKEPPFVVESITKTVVGVLNASNADKVKLRNQRLPFAAKLLADVDATKMPWKRAVKYMATRGFTLDDMIRCDVHYCPSGRYRNYLVFPVNQGGETIYWTSRFAGEDAMVKSWNPEKADDRYGREHCVLGYDEAVGEPVVALVEGPLDRMAPEVAIALMGKEMSDTQADLIIALVDQGLEELVIMLDYGTGKKTDSIYRKLLDQIPKVTVCYFNEDGDPADSRDELPELMEERRAPTLSDRIRSRLS